MIIPQPISEEVQPYPHDPDGVDIFTFSRDRWLLVHVHDPFWPPEQPHPMDKHPLIIEICNWDF